MQIGSVELVFQDAIGVDERLEERVRTLLSAVEGSFVCNRKFGIRSDLVDQPVQIAQVNYAADVYEKMEMFIPQLIVEDIRFQIQDDTLTPILSLAENEEYEEEVSDSDTGDPEVGEEDEYERDERF